MRHVGLRCGRNNGRRRSRRDKSRLLLLTDGRDVSRGLKSAKHLFGELLDDFGMNLGGGAGTVKDVRHRVVNRLAMGRLIAVWRRVGRV